MTCSLPGTATFRHSQIASCHFINSKYPHLNQAGKENIYACLSGGLSFFFWGSPPGCGPGLEECNRSARLLQVFLQPRGNEDSRISQESSGGNEGHQEGWTQEP